MVGPCGSDWTAAARVSTYSFSYLVSIDVCHTKHGITSGKREKGGGQGEVRRGRGGGEWRTGGEGVEKD